MKAAPATWYLTHPLRSAKVSIMTTDRVQRRLNLGLSWNMTLRTDRAGSEMQDGVEYYHRRTHRIYCIYFMSWLNDFCLEMSNEAIKLSLSGRQE